MLDKGEMKEMKEECLICKAPLEYLNKDIEMECELCHKKERSKTRCEMATMYAMNVTCRELTVLWGSAWRKHLEIRR